MPLTIRRFKRDLRRAHGAFRRDERLPLLRGLRLRLHDVDGRHRADLDLRLVVAEQLFGEAQRLAGDLDRLYREHVVPVRVPDVRDSVDRGLLQLDIGDVLVDARDEQLLARGVDLEIAKQRLRVLRRPRRGVLRVDRGVQRRRVRRRLSSWAEKVPPPHGTSCASPPLNTNVLLLMVATRRRAGNRARRRVLGCSGC